MSSKHGRLCSFLTVLAVMTALLAACGPAGKTGNTPPPQSANGPAFVISSPPDGSYTAGTFMLSVQPLDPGAVASVSYRVGTQDVSAVPNGLHAFADASGFPAGRLEISATVTGKDGRTRVREVVVTNVPEPAERARVTDSGAVMGTLEADGSLSTIIIPPGGMDGAEMTFRARTQADVLASTGVDYDSLGITFLGAQEITSSRVIDRTPLVTSGGFGGAVQPGQVVVNYMILPDADNDGIGEIVVVNSATVTPGGDVISNPVPVVQVGEFAGASQLGTSSVRPLDGLTGPPGTILRIPVAGFSPSSIWGSVAVFQQGSETIEQTGLISTSAAGAQTFTTLIPPLRPGVARMSLYNVGSGYHSEQFTITVTDFPEPAGDPLEAIDASVDALAAMLQAFDVETGLDSTELQAAMNRNIDFWTGELLDDGSPEALSALRNMAAMFQVADVTRLASDVTADLRGRLRPAQGECNDILDRADLGVNTVGWISRIPYLTLRPTNAVDILGPEMQGDLVSKGWKWTKDTMLEIDRQLGGNACRPDEDDDRPGPSTPPPDESSPEAPPPVSGMGAAFPPGGSVSGVVTSPGTNAFSPRSTAPSRGRTSVQVTSSFPVPFSGSTDASGHFEVPLTPEGETITVTVVDRETGGVDIIEIEAPPLGETRYLSFSPDVNFTAEENRWTGAAGDGQWATADNWSHGRVPGAMDDVVIDSPGAVVSLDRLFTVPTVASLTVRRGELHLVGGGELIVLRDSTVGPDGTLYVNGNNVRLQLDSELENQGRLEFHRGELIGTVRNSGVITFTTSVSVRRFGGDLVNSGMIVFTGTGSEGVRMGPNSVIDNLATGVIDFRNDTGLAHGGDPRAVLTNSGLIRKSAGDGVSRMLVSLMNQGGTLESLSGVLRVQEAGLEGGTYEAAAGAAIELGETTSRVTLSGTLSGGGAGEVRFTAETYVPDHATLGFSPGGAQFARGTLQGTGSLTNLELMELIAVNAVYVYELNIVNEGTFNVRGTVAAALRIGRGARIDNEGSFSVEGDLNIGRGGDPVATFRNAGSVSKVGGTGTSSLALCLITDGGTVTGSINFTGCP